MNFNLQNFPRFNGNIKEYLEGVIPWKIGFENELRETLVWLEKWKPRTEVNKATKESWKHTIEEVLGVEPKIKEEIEK